MANILNNATGLKEREDNCRRKAPLMIDEVLRHLPDGEDFLYHMKVPLPECEEQVKALLIKYGYVEPVGKTYLLRLTDPGRAAKQDGHEKYQQSLRPHWSVTQPIAYEIFKGALTGAITLVTGIGLFLWQKQVDSRTEGQVYKELKQQLQAVSRKVDSLTKAQKK